MTTQRNQAGPLEVAASSTIATALTPESVPRSVSIGGCRSGRASEANKLEMVGELRVAKTEGDVIEVAVTVPDEGEKSMQSARRQVESLLGFVAFNLGEGALGEHLIEEYSVAGPEGELGEIRIPVRQVRASNLQN